MSGGPVGVAGVAEFIRMIASKKLFTSLYFRSCENPPGLGRSPIASASLAIPRATRLNYSALSECRRESRKISALDAHLVSQALGG